MADKTWKQWDIDIHYSPEQVKRRLNSEKIKTESIFLDYESQTAVIIGSDPNPYTVTLLECSCFDFSHRGLPCKHMYRLANELGVLEPWPKLSRKGSKAVMDAADAEIQRWKDEFIAGNISAKKYTKIVDALLCK